MTARSLALLTTSPPMSLLQAASVFSWLMFTTRTAEASWGNNYGNTNYALYGNGLTRDWLYNSKGISISVHGCLWSFNTDKYSNDDGCLQDNSEDGTDVWYWMSNCRRAQVAFSVYASDSSTTPSCNSNNFKESFVTTTGAMDFIAYMEDAGVPFSAQYDYPMCGGGNGNKDRMLNDQRNNNNNNYRKNNNNYGGTKVGLSCASDGSFQLETFSDYYCLARTGSIYDDLYSFNQDISSNLDCVNIYSSNGQDNAYYNNYAYYNNNNQGGNNNNNNQGGSLIQYLIAISDTCSSHDTSLCSDSAAVQTRLSYSSHNSANNLFHHHSAMSAGAQSWITKLKYVTGGLLLLASFVMFTGILFTNRRRRRALMQRKYRQSKRAHSSGRSRRSSRSVSKARKDSSSRKSSSRSRRSKSRDTRKTSTERSSPAKESQKESESKENEGVMT